MKEVNISGYYELQDKLSSWMTAVLECYENRTKYSHCDTLKMLIDVDKIISTSFEHSVILTDEILH